MKAILTKYRPATNTRGSRYLATDDDGNRCSVPTNYALNSDGNHRAAALALCQRMGWHGALLSGSLGKNQVHVWAEEQSLYVVPKHAA